MKDPGPFQRFAALLQQAEALYGLEYNMMQVATADGRGRPSTRVLLLKGFDEQGFVFYTNLGSRKARELRENPWAAMCFWWPRLEEQVRIEGQAIQVSDEEADAYFATRPRGSQLGAWASRQSEPLPSREALEAKVLELEREYEGKVVPRPPFWSGYRVVPEQFEFWHNRPSRLHDRAVYVRDADGWRLGQLYP
jgi:pyridoxamine 5'-phosphate oxidase